MDGKAGTTKRKRKVLTIGTKVEILKELKHQSASSLEKQYGVGVSFYGMRYQEKQRENSIILPVCGKEGPRRQKKSHEKSYR